MSVTLRELRDSSSGPESPLEAADLRADSLLGDVKLIAARVKLPYFATVTNVRKWRSSKPTSGSTSASVRAQQGLENKPYLSRDNESRLSIRHLTTSVALKMPDIAIVYPSKFGHTKAVAEAVGRGVGRVENTILHLVDVEHDMDIATGVIDWKTLDGAAAIVFGSATYMGREQRHETERLSAAH